MSKKCWYLSGLLVMVLLASCTSNQSSQIPPTQPLTGDSSGLHVVQQSTPPPAKTIPQRRTTPTATPTLPIARTGMGAAPYGSPPPLTAEEIQLTQQLFALINHDRAVRGLSPFVWNSVLAGGARLHSWNMYHCGFSHTCPDGRTQNQRIADEGFAGYTNCGENIGLAGPYPTAWGGIYAIQESMINEPPTGWHRRQLTSTTLHKIGIGLYTDPRGWIWFTEDMVS